MSDLDPDMTPADDVDELDELDPSTDDALDSDADGAVEPEEELEVPAQPGDEYPEDERIIVWMPAAPPAAIAAARAVGCTVVDEPSGAQLCLVSTRAPRSEIAGVIITASQTAANLPVVAFAHPGGEQGAVEATRAGAASVVAEGDRTALVNVAEGAATVDGSGPALVDAYEARMGRGTTTRVTGAANQISGLPSGSALAARLVSATDVETRVMSFHVMNLQRSMVRMSPDAQTLLLRRLGRTICNVLGDTGELFDLGDGSYAIVSTRLNDEAADLLGRQLASIVEAYAPDAHSPLTLAVGHAGPECGTDAATLRELAQRAETAAALEETSSVLGAGELVGPLATATELEVVLRLVDVVERAGDMPDAANRARVAADIATRLGFDAAERAMVRFVAHVADIGLVRIPEVSWVEGTPEWQTYPTAGAEYLAAIAGRSAAVGVQHTRENWDGSGFPGSLVGPAIPAASRIAAVARELVASGGSVDSLRAGSGTRFDPSVVEAAIELATEEAFDWVH